MRTTKALITMAAAALFVGCSESAPTKMLIPSEPLLGTFDPGGTSSNTAQAERLEVCKVYVMTSGAPVPATTSFTFSSVADPAKNQAFSITSAANNTPGCREIWLDGAAGGNVTVTEPAINGFRTKVTVIQDIGGVDGSPVTTDPGSSATGLVSGSAGPNGVSTGQLFTFTNTEEVNTGGCTLTQGYWKTHSSHGPATPPDAIWATVGGPDATFYFSGKSWFDLFWTAPKGGNSYIQLAHQYMAAVLNVNNGALPAPAELALATAFFNNAANTPSTTYTKAQQATQRAWASALDAFNQGTTGPGHC